MNLKIFTLLVLFVILFVLIITYDRKNKYNNRKFNFILLINRWPSIYKKFRFNNVTIDKFNNKINSYHMCKKLKIPVPELYYNGNYNLISESVFYNKAFVIKPANGSSSNGVFPVVKHKNNTYINIFNNNILRKTDFNSIFNNVNVIVEEFILDTNGNYTIPDDYKFFCFKGKLEFLKHRYLDNKTKKYHFNYYDMDWNVIDINLEVPNKQIRSKKIKKPLNFDKMKEYCQKISSKVFSQVFVRLDFYLNLDQPVFGEVTPEPLGGIGYSKKGIEFLDNLCRKHNLNLDFYK